MKTVKYRLDFSAHTSIVVEVPDTENSEEKAIEIAEKYMTVSQLPTNEFVGLPLT